MTDKEENEIVIKFYRIPKTEENFLDFYMKKENSIGIKLDLIAEFLVQKGKAKLTKCENMEYLPYCEKKAKEFVKANRKFI